MVSFTLNIVRLMRVINYMSSQLKHEFIPNIRKEFKLQSVEALKKVFLGDLEFHDDSGKSLSTGYLIIIFKKIFLIRQYYHLEYILRYQEYL